MVKWEDILLECSAFVSLSNTVLHLFLLSGYVQATLACGFLHKDHVLVLLKIFQWLPTELKVYKTWTYSVYQTLYDLATANLSSLIFYSFLPVHYFNYAPFVAKLFLSAKLLYMPFCIPGTVFLSSLHMADASHPLDLSINITISERPSMATLFNVIILYKGIKLFYSLEFTRASHFSLINQVKFLPRILLVSLWSFC